MCCAVLGQFAWIELSLLYMNEEMRNEAVDLVSTAVEKHAGNYELAARMIKETMDKKCASFANLGVPCASYLYPFTLQLLPGPPPP